MYVLKCHTAVNIGTVSDIGPRDTSLTVAILTVMWHWIRPYTITDLYDSHMQVMQTKFHGNQSMVKPLCQVN